MAEVLEGYGATIRAMEELESGKFVRSGLRRALREAANIEKGKMIAVIPTESGITSRNVKVRAGKRSRTSISILVGVFAGMAVKLDVFKNALFYAGFANFGHKSPKGKTVAGDRWTDAVKDDVAEAGATVAGILAEEVASLGWKK